MKIKQVDILLEANVHILIFELDNGLIVDCYLNEYGFSATAESGEHLTVRERLLLPEQYINVVNFILSEFGVNIGEKKLDIDNYFIKYYN